MLDLHAEGVVARIRSEHRYHWIKLGAFRYRRVCALCGQMAPCNRQVLADDIQSGRRDVAGNPLWKDSDEVVLPLRFWQVVRWIAFCVAVAAVFGWPGPELMS